SPPCLSLILSTPPPSTPFPYTTLFRSKHDGDPARDRLGYDGLDSFRPFRTRMSAGTLQILPRVAGRASPLPAVGDRRRVVVRPRSEEHTSELQSRENLVCRLLLEKKNS